MARTGRPKAVLRLEDEEREALTGWARRPLSPQSLALRSKIVLGCAAGKTNQEVAAELGCSQATVGKWRARFVAKRLKGLADEYRSGAPHTVLDKHVEAVIALRSSTYMTPKRQTVREFLEGDWLPAVRSTLATSTWESYVATSGSTWRQALAVCNFSRLAVLY